MARRGIRIRSKCLHRGFTLLELMVVIGIIVVLMALTIPVGKSLREGNRMMACSAHLHAIHQAMKLYFLDERGVPPYELAAGDDPSDTSTVPVGPGLHALYDAGYLGRESTLHCPRHLGIANTHPDYYHSYDGRDAQATYSASNNLSALTQYKYLPYRGVDDDQDPDYRRQLARGTGTVTVYDPTWQPDDSAVVCWCDYHAESFTRGGEGQYHVLFWGGEVMAKPKSLFRSATAEAWRVRPED